MSWSEKQKGDALAQTLAGLLGIFAFLLAVGPRALNPQNIAWLSSGDPATHYLGWLFYRNAEWTFPIGLNPAYGLELGSSIVYSDSIPLFAILFKILSPLLPATFQYFGIWLLLCFILQAIFGFKLVSLVSSSTLLRLLGAGFIVFSPPMIFRTLGHLSLVGHFLIIASLYLALNPDKHWIKFSWAVLLAAAALIHPYLLVMVLGIWSADLLGRACGARASCRRVASEVLPLSGLVVFLCWQAGYFVLGSVPESSGYGYYRMNILSPLDPAWFSNKHQGDWSYILKDLRQAQGDYEGFNFLGLGAIFLLAVSLPIAVVMRQECLKLLQKNLFLLMFCLVFSLFAITNSPAIGGLEFGFPLPALIMDLANIFRGSGRFFWPVFYIITFLLIALVVKGLGARKAVLVLCVALVAQIVDTSAGWLPLRNKNMVASSADWESPFVDDFWSEAVTKYQKLRHIPFGKESVNWLPTAYYAGQNRLGTDAVYLARIDPEQRRRSELKAAETLRNSVFDSDSLYILDDSSFRQALFERDQSADLFAQIDGFNVIAPGWKACNECQFAGEEVEFKDLFEPIVLSEELSFNPTSKGLSYLIDGWGKPERWGTWSTSHSASIFLPITATQLQNIYIDFRAFILDSLSTQRVEIFLNDVQVFSGHVRDRRGRLELKIPDAVKSDSFSSIRIKFQFPDAAKPVDLGLNSDGRTLALGLHAISFR